MLLALVAASFVILVAHRFLREERRVDDCLSGRHGSFDYSKMSCDLNENHVYVPYTVRHPHDESIAWAASALLLIFTSGYVYLRDRAQK